MGEPIEERMLAEWVAANLEPGTYAIHLRLGQPATVPPGETASAEERALHLVSLPTADVVGLEGGDVVVTEFIIWRPQETVGQLLYYASLIPTTPGYAGVAPERIRKRIVTGLTDPRFLAWARSLGIEVVEYRPAWLEKALARRRGK